jgi:polyferredoxin
VTENSLVFRLKMLRGPLILFLSFWAIAIFLWRANGNIFYLFNFGYIGTAVGVGIGLYVLLPRKLKPTGRRLAQLLVGVYMLGFLGIIKLENMQLEGFFFYLLSGYFAGSVIHYLVAKILGPILFGRGFCGWACWTAMILDFLPYKKNKKGRLLKRWELLRYVHFGFSLLLVLLFWFVYHYRPVPIGKSELVWLVSGNTFYFVSAIVLAFALKDNRAFCKYLCPITIVLKITSRFALLKIEGRQEGCTQCGACSKACPMDINIMEYVRNGERVLSTECIFCLTCTTVCPEAILDGTFKVDIGGNERIRRVDIP